MAGLAGIGALALFGVSVDAAFERALIHPNDISRYKWNGSTYQYSLSHHTNKYPSTSLLRVVLHQLLPETLFQVLQGQLVLAHLELHLDRLAHELHLLSPTFAKELVLENLVDCGTCAGVKVHRHAEDVDHLLGHLREHFIETLLLPALQTSEVVLGVLVREELHFLRGGLAQGG